MADRDIAIDYIVHIQVIIPLASCVGCPPLYHHKITETLVSAVSPPRQTVGAAMGRQPALPPLCWRLAGVISALLHAQAVVGLETLGTWKAQVGTNTDRIPLQPAALRLGLLASQDRTATSTRLVISLRLAATSNPVSGTASPPSPPSGDLVRTTQAPVSRPPATTGRSPPTRPGHTKGGSSPSRPVMRDSSPASSSS